MRAFCASLALLASLASLPVAASAASATRTMIVTASVPANCSVTTESAIDFGTYDTVARAHGGPLDVTVQAVSIACTKGSTGVTIALDQGEYARGSHRAMLGETDEKTVAYEIYTTPQRSTVWNAINTVAYIPQSDASVTVPFYGRIPAGQNVPPGRYSDVLLAMVNF